MSLQTIVNLHCPDASKYYAVAIRNAGSTLVAADSPIVDTDAAGTAGQFWDFTANAFSAAGTNRFSTLTQLAPGGQAYNLPVQLHAPNRHYGVDLYESSFPAWEPNTVYAAGAQVVLQGTGLVVTTAAGGTSGAVEPAGNGADGTVLWAGAVAHSDNDFVCVPGDGSSVSHWTGDMNFRLEGSGDGSCIPQGSTFTGTVALTVDGEAISPALFGNAFLTASSAGVLNTAIDANGILSVTVDTTGVAVGTTIEVDTEVTVKGSTNANAPDAKVLRDKIVFSVCDPVSDPFALAVDGSGAVAAEGDGSYGAGSFGRCLEDVICVTATYDTTGDAAANATFTEAIQELLNCSLEIKEDTNELQTDWTDGGRLDTILDNVEADTSEVQVSLADGGFTNNLIDAIQTDVDDLQVDVDALQVDVSQVLTTGGAGPWTSGAGAAALTQQEIADAILLTPTGQGSSAYQCLVDIKQDTNEVQLSLANGGLTNNLLDDLQTTATNILSTGGVGPWTSGTVTVGDITGLQLEDSVPGTNGGTGENGWRTVAEVLSCVSHNVCDSCYNDCHKCKCNKSNACW